MAGTLQTYWEKYKAISPWVAMYQYMVALTLWGILFLSPHDDRAVLAMVVVATGVGLDYALHKLQTGKPNWQSALITSAIVAVLLPPDVDIAVAFLAVALAIASKHFLLTGKDKRHVFNPAGFGVAVTAALFGYSLGWWPDSYLWLTLFFGVLNVWRIKKWPQVLSFTAAYIVLVTVTAGFPSGSLDISSLGIQTLPVALPYFFILFMIPEPMTSPDPKRRQVEFGVLAAAVGVAASYVGPLDDAAVIWGLLAANVYAWLRK